MLIRYEIIKRYAIIKQFLMFSLILPFLAVIITITIPLLGLVKIVNSYPEMLEYAYEELLLNIVADKIPNGNDQKDTIKNVCSFMEEEIYCDTSFYLPSNSINVLTMGNALCSASSRLMGKLFEKKKYILE